MSLAILVSLRSKDLSSKVGAVLVKDNKVMGTGYNGFPSGADEAEFPVGRDVEGDGWLNTKYPYVIHAEANALLNSVASPRGAELFVTLQPCNECAKLLVQAGVTRVTYLDDKYRDGDAFVAARKLLDVAGIPLLKMDAAKLNIPLITSKFESYRKS